MLLMKFVVVVKLVEELLVVRSLQAAPQLLPLLLK